MTALDELMWDNVDRALDTLTWWDESNVWSTVKVGRLQLWKRRTPGVAHIDKFATYGNYYVVLKHKHTGQPEVIWDNCEPLLAQCLVNHYGAEDGELDASLGENYSYSIR
jgi:hypothetical protein